MIRALSLAAALAVLPVSSAVAKEATTSAEAAVEAAAKTFEARMEAFGDRAEAIAENEGLTEAQREARITSLWAEYAPDVAVFTAAVTEHAGAVAASALAGIDIEALVAEAMDDVDIGAEVSEALSDQGVAGEVSRALAEAGIADGGVGKVVEVGLAIAANGAWAVNDPEQAVTYGLVAQYALDQATRGADAVDQDD